jgi:hypothetical protein
MAPPCPQGWGGAHFFDRIAPPAERGAPRITDRRLTAIHATAKTPFTVLQGRLLSNTHTT